MNTALTIANGANRLVRVIGEIMAWTGLAMVLVITANVMSRYFFSYGSVALQELEWHLLAVGALFGMPYAVNQGEEVRVDVLYAHFGPRTKRWVNALSSLLLGLVAVAVAYLSIGFVRQSFLLMEGSPDPGGLPYRWFLKATIPAAFFLLAIQSFARFVFDIAKLTGHRPIAPTES